MLEEGTSFEDADIRGDGVAAVSVDVQLVPTARQGARIASEAGRIEHGGRMLGRRPRRGVEEPGLRARIRIAKLLVLSEFIRIVHQRMALLAHADADADADGEQHCRDENGEKDPESLKRKRKRNFLVIEKLAFLFRLNYTMNSLDGVRQKMASSVESYGSSASA